MQLGIGKTMFPAWSASVTLVKAHGTDAVGHATDAMRAGSGTERLDSAVRAMTSFDHAIDNSRKLPVSWFVRRAPVYYRGYEAAKQAVTLLVGSGLIPGAKERVGRQSFLAGQGSFKEGMVVAVENGSRYGRHLASGWLEAAAEDALTGVTMLPKGSDTGRALLGGLNQLRAAVAQKRPVDRQLAETVNELFGRAASELALEIARSGGRPVAASGPAFEQSAKLLAQAQQAAQALVDDVDVAAATHLTAAAS